MCDQAPDAYFCREMKTHCAHTQNTACECFRRVIWKSQKLEANQMSFSEEWIKDCHLYSGILHHNKKEWARGTHHNVDKTPGPNAEWR